MTDVEKIREALELRELWREIEALDRLAARVGEADAPKWPYGNPYIGDSALVPCRVEHFYPEVVSGHGDMVKLSIGSAEVIVPVSWTRPLPAPPETNDGR